MAVFTRREVLGMGAGSTTNKLLEKIGARLKPPKQTEQVIVVKEEKVVETPAEKLDPTYLWTPIAHDVMLPESNGVLGPMEPLDQMTIGGKRYAVAYQRSRDNRGLYLTELVEGHQGVEPIELNSLEGADWMSVHAVNIQEKTGSPDVKVVCVITEQLVKGQDNLYDLQFWANLAEVGSDGQIQRRRRVVLPMNVTGVSGGYKMDLTDKILVDMARDGIKVNEIQMRERTDEEKLVDEEAGIKSMDVSKARGFCDGNRLLISHSGKTYECTSIQWGNPQKEIFTEMRYIDYPFYPGYSGAFAFEKDGKLYSYTDQGLVQVMPGPTYDFPKPLPNASLEGLGRVMEIIATGQEFVVVGRSEDQVKVWIYDKKEKKFVSKFTFTDSRWIFLDSTNIKLVGEQLVIPRSSGEKPGVVVFNLGKGEDGKHKGVYTRYEAPGMATMGLDEGGITVIKPQHNNKGGNSNPDLCGLSPIESNIRMPVIASGAIFVDSETN